MIPDTSVWVRGGDSNVAAVLADALDANAVAITPPLILEMLRGARSRDHFRRLVLTFASLRQVPVTEAIAQRARQVQAALVDRGQHPGPSVIDLLTAAAAELTGATVWHCDKHFDQIAAVTGQPIERLGR